MKKSIFVMLTTFSIYFATAQTNTGGAGTKTQTGTATGIQIPPTVNTRFGSENPSVSPTWSMEGNNYSATYTDQSTHMGRTVVYDKKGTILHTDNEMGTGAYPVAIDDYFTKNYPNETNKVWSSMDGNGNTVYYSKRNGTTMWFDKNGTYTSLVPVSKTGKEK